MHAAAVADSRSRSWSPLSHTRVQTTKKMDVDVSKSVDDLVQKVSLHIPRPTIIHGYSLPFIFLYGLWFYLWVFVYGVEEYPEAGWITLAGIGLIQILVSLSCYWSVHIRTLLTCSNTSDPLEAIYVKVVPTPNNGASQLVAIHKAKVIFLYIWFKELLIFLNHLECPRRN